ncbi:MAG: hypothetical protein ACLFRX_06305 [Gemmatimonadota bacterium]
MRTLGTRTVIDRTRDAWTVEEQTLLPDGTPVLRYRHELGYEIAATAPKRLEALTRRELARILEEARRRTPSKVAADAA